MAIFDHAGQKIIESTISFPEFPSASKKQFTPSAHAFDHDPPPPKIIKHLMICMNLYQHAKHQLILSVHSPDTITFRVQRPDWLHRLLTIPNQKSFNQLFIFKNLQKHAKNETVS